MALDETLRGYQTKGTPQTKKLDTTAPKDLMSPPQGVAVQFNDVTKKELGHSDCPGCMY